MLHGATCTRQEAWAGEVGTEICLPEGQGPTVG